MIFNLIPKKEQAYSSIEALVIMQTYKKASHSKSREATTLWVINQCLKVS